MPWSGSQRDVYGYFHATYIYLILAMFFERVVDSNRGAQQDALTRLAPICAGLGRALDDFADADLFTETGKVFFDRLARHAVMVIGRNRHLFAGCKRSDPRLRQGGQGPICASIRQSDGELAPGGVAAQTACIDEAGQQGEAVEADRGAGAGADPAVDDPMAQGPFCFILKRAVEWPRFGVTH